MKKSYAYNSIIFLQGEEAEEALEVLEEEGKFAAISYLAQWDYGDADDITLDPPWGVGIATAFSQGYYLSWNSGLGYISLTRPVTKGEFES